MWLPKRFKQVPENLTEEQLQDWYEQRARFRWSRTQFFDNGDMQFRCPQCAGRLVTNLTTHRKRARPNKSAPFVKVTHHDDKCCKGLATIPVDKLNYWQPTPWGTRAWKASYHRRLQVENVNSMVKEKGGLDAELCRVRGLGPHTLAVLAVSIAHNLKQAKKDPYADDANDDNTGEGEPEKATATTTPATAPATPSRAIPKNPTTTFPKAGLELTYLAVPITATTAATLSEHRPNPF